MGKCPRGFPGCPQADDMMVAADASCRRLLAEKLALTEQFARCRQVLREVWHLLEGEDQHTDELAARVEAELNAE